MKIDVTSNVKAVLAKVRHDIERQVASAAAKALTDTARDVRQAEMAEMQRVLDRPIPFTMRGIGYAPANASNLTARVFVRDAQLAYLGIQVSGGLEHPKGRAFLKPVGVGLNQYGNIPRRKIKQLLARKDTFSGTVHGIGGIWQRVGQKGLKLLVAYERPRQVKARLDFFGVANRTIERRLQVNLRARLAAELRG